jgi:hypothetical protein
MGLRGVGLSGTWLGRRGGSTGAAQSGLRLLLASCLGVQVARWARAERGKRREWVAAEGEEAGGDGHWVEPGRALGLGVGSLVGRLG